MKLKGWSKGKMARIITITSGKGGVGKTNISLNLSLHLASQGKKTCLFDADLGLANINILLGLQPQYTLKDLVLGGRDLQDILIKDYEGIDILPGSSGVEELVNLGEEQTADLVKSLAQLDEYDFLLFDTSAGISKNVVSFCLAALEVVVIITPEPTSLTDAYSLVKVLSMNGNRGKLSVIVNQCKDFTVAKTVYTKFRAAVQKYLGISVHGLGVIFEDQKVVEAVREQRPLLLLYPNSTASQCIRKIGHRLLEGADEHLPEMGMAGFWKRWLSAARSPLRVKKRKQPEQKTKADQEAQAQKGRSRQGSDRPAKADDFHTQGVEGKETIQGTSEAVINQLAKSLATVSEELRLIRNALERNGRFKEVGKEYVTGTSEQIQRPRIKLDLEAFLRTREAGNTE